MTAPRLVKTFRSWRSLIPRLKTSVTSAMPSCPAWYKKLAITSRYHRICDLVNPFVRRVNVRTGSILDSDESMKAIYRIPRDGQGDQARAAPRSSYPGRHPAVDSILPGPARRANRRRDSVPHADTLPRRSAPSEARVIYLGCRAEQASAGRATTAPIQA
jgi:hypothetical protein